MKELQLRCRAPRPPASSQFPEGQMLMSTQPAEALPKSAAAVCPQWVRCGKRGCRCARGELHGPYSYLFWRSGGRLRKRYVRLADASAVEEATRRQRENARQTREGTRHWHERWQALLSDVREHEQHERE